MRPDASAGDLPVPQSREHHPRKGATRSTLTCMPDKRFLTLAEVAEELNTSLAQINA